MAEAVAKAPGNTGSSGTQNVPKPRSSASLAARMKSPAFGDSKAIPNSFTFGIVVCSPLIVLVLRLLHLFQQTLCFLQVCNVTSPCRRVDCLKTGRNIGRQSGTKKVMQ